jgi:hypothetical protein
MITPAKSFNFLDEKNFEVKFFNTHKDLVDFVDKSSLKGDQMIIGCCCNMLAEHFKTKYLEGNVDLGLLNQYEAILINHTTSANHN